MKRCSTQQKKFFLTFVFYTFKTSENRLQETQDRCNTAERKLSDQTHIMAELTQKVCTHSNISSILKHQIHFIFLMIVLTVIDSTLILRFKDFVEI